MNATMHDRRLPSDSLFTAANVLSLARVPLGLLFWLVLSAPWGGAWPATAVLAVAALTDALDGIMARRAASRRAGGVPVETPAGMGSWLDPVCDKLFVGSVLAAIWVELHPSLALLALIVARELAQLPLSLVYVAVPHLRRWLRYDFRASVLGKAATVTQFGAVFALIHDSTATVPLAIASLALGLLALGDYVLRAVRLGRARLAEDAANDPRPAGGAGASAKLGVAAPSPEVEGGGPVRDAGGARG